MSKGKDVELQAATTDLAGQSASSSNFRQHSSMGNPSGGPAMTSSHFKLVPGFIGAGLSSSETLPLSELDIVVLYAKTHAAGVEIPAATWQRDADPIFIWEPPPTGAPLAGYSYALDGAPDDTVDTTATWFDVATSPLIRLADGTHTFSVKAINTLGSTGQPISMDLWVDTAPPQVVSYTPAAAALLKSPPTVTVVLSDPLSGVKASTLTLLLNGTALALLYDAATGTATSSGGTWLEGTNQLELRVADLAGNVQVPLVWSVSIDTQPPTGTVTINGGAVMTTSVDVTLGLSAADATSSVVSMRISNDPFTGFVEEPYATLRPLWRLTAVRGIQTVYVKFVDQAGNVSAPVSDSIDLALLAPDTTITSGPAGFTMDQSGTFTFTCSTGSCLFSYAFDADEWSAWSPAATATKAGLALGNHYFRVKAAQDVNGIPGIQADEEDPSPAERTWVRGIEPSLLNLPKGPPIKLWRLE